MSKKKRKMDFVDFILGIILGFLFCSALFLILFYVEIPEKNFDLKTNSSIEERDIIEKCEGFDLINTTICLVESVDEFFIYNITDDSENLSFYELKTRGGDCRDWALFYERISRNLGFNASTIRTEGILDVIGAHRVAVVWNETYRCTIDMLSVTCDNRNFMTPYSITL